MKIQDSSLKPAYPLEVEADNLNLRPRLLTTSATHPVVGHEAGPYPSSNLKLKSSNSLPPLHTADI